MVHADDVNILEGSVHTINKNAEALVVTRKEIGLEVHTDKSKYMVMSGEHNRHNRKIGNTPQLEKSSAYVYSNTDNIVFGL